MVLAFGQHDRFSRDKLGRLRLTRLQGHLHRFDERPTDVAHYLPPGRINLRIESQGAHDILNYLDVVFGLLEILLPLFFELIIYYTTKRGRINLYASHFSFERLIQKL